MQDNEIQFVPYSIATAIKELGYDGLCCIKDFDLQNKTSLHDSEITTYKNSEERVSAPTVDQVFDWMEKELGYYFFPIKSQNKSGYWRGVVRKVDDYHFEVSTHDVKSSREAKLECISKVIEIVKNK